ncbi:tRNA pseudouridine(38-40) synthase TruA [Usitatibacter palustris]|uniref:tRNA pseudouridine synthase A n=1 Tax=Usitatibacter palustris TaxID=2732487 RepID=A0A6M4H502_9PROT|nr:tRNA pseudouridine(38-40) synthase TruA [Usitatibacter palustris]QJR14676.1 tRNA pseudouridine synthase A [Usitatibacter palustris]
MRMALGIEYDGTAFCGWQTQPGGCGVQDHLQAALSRFADAPIEVTAAGRTDAGVHATGQVVHFDTDAVRENVSWVRGPNTFLDPRVRVVWAKTVPDDFHARYSARSRTYHYLLLDDPVAPAALHDRVGWFHLPLDVGAMKYAAKSLVGEHDFSAFRDAQCQAKSPVRDVYEVRVERVRSLVIFTLRANAFLHHMVRNIVGSLVYVGAGRQPETWLLELLEGRDRKLAAPTFAAEGLYLSAVEYDSAFALPAFRRNALLEVARVVDGS